MYVLQSTDVHAWVVLCLHYMLIKLVDCYMCLKNLGQIKYCSIVTFKNDQKMHFQGYTVLLFILLLF